MTSPGVQLAGGTPEPQPEPDQQPCPATAASAHPSPHRQSEESDQDHSGRAARRRARGRIPAVAALVVFLSGVYDLAVVLIPHLRYRRVDTLANLLPGSVTHLAIAGTVMIGALLLLLAKGLHRRKRRAWRLALVLTAGATVLHLGHARGLPGAILSALVFLLLAVFQREFTAKGDPRTRWSGLGYGLLLVVGEVAIGLLVLSAHPGALAGHPAVSARLLQVLEGLVGVSGPVHFRSDGFSDLTYDIFAGFGALVAGVVAYLVLRPAEPRCSLSGDDESRMRELLRLHGARDSLGYFALRRDKSVVWSPSGKACVAYRVVSGVMLASGDPLGDPEAWPGAMSRFLDMAADHAWVPAVMGCSEQAGTAWSRQGLDALEIGDEAVVEVCEFSLEGRAMRNVRQAVSRVERAGYTVAVRKSNAIDEPERAVLRSQAAAWRGTETERGFSMALGRFGDPADGDCVWVTASLNGRLRAFLHFVPWGDDGLSLDLMRRDRDADNGLNELLIVSMLRAAPDLGIARVSLNFSVFRSALERGERLGAGFVLRAWRGLLLFVSRWFQIETLYRFNAKFRPIWEPRFVCYPSAADLPRVALAALEAEAFIVWPSAWRTQLARLRHPGRRLAVEAR